jgi:hypothetical protein
MRVGIPVSAFYDQAPVPDDVDVTASDIASGKVKPGKSGGFTARVTRKMPSYCTVLVAESELIERLIFELIPRPGMRKLGKCNRMQLLAEHLDANVLPEQCHPKHMLGFHVENDDGPDEALLRKRLSVYTEAKHHLTGDPLIDPAEVEAIVAKYLEPTTHQSHIDHLHARFGVAKAS